MSDGAYLPPALFVTWQDPTSRTVYPVGRLARLALPSAGYEFAYLRAAVDAARVGFAPFPGFQKLEVVYHSAELPPFFENRVLSRSRPEFASHLAEMGLDPTATPVDILSRTNGRRATDTYEVFSEFEPATATDEWSTRFFVRSMRYLALPEVVSQLRPGERLYCMRDVQNPKDPVAIGLRTEGNAFVGFCPAYLVGELDEPLTMPQSVTVTVERINLPPAALQNRVQCGLTIRTSNGFHCYRRGRFEPVSDGAIRLDPWQRRAKVA